MKLLEVIKGVFKDAAKLSLDLFKIMVPLIIGVKILKELGLIEYLAVPLSPLMEWVGLPAQTALVWATAMANTLYAAILVYAALLPDMPVMSVAQVTVMCTMMLIAHNLPVETRITRECGAKMWGQVLLRILGAYLCGLLMHLVFTYFGLLAEPAVMVFKVEAGEQTWAAWAWGEIRNLGVIFCIILVLMAVMRLLDFLKITNLFIRILEPVLRLIGIGKAAGTITIVGLTMGIAYGGGLIIHEAKSGQLSRADIFSSVSLMGLSHGLIEDTLLMMLLGAGLTGILWGRLIFSLLVMAVLTRLVSRYLNDNQSMASRLFFVRT